MTAICLGDKLKSFGAGGAVQPQVGMVKPHLGTRLAGMQPTLGHGGAPCIPNVVPPPPRGGYRTYYLGFGKNGV